MIKAAFFDVDGTLLSFKTHLMSESTKRALAALRAQGIKTVVSSGRPTYQLPPCIRTGFDAYVTLNGQLCFDDEGVFRSSPLDDADVRAIVGQVEAGRYDVLVLQEERAFVSHLTERIATLCQQVGLQYEADDISHAFDAPVYQMCAFVDPGEEAFMEVTQHVAHTRWTELFCDVIPDVGGKRYGVEAALARYGLTPDEAVAFGDGENDVSMFEAVGTSVAMGNAWDAVKEQATYVTDDVDHDGVYNACRRLNLF